MLTDIREYIDRLRIEGHTIGEDHDDDPFSWIPTDAPSTPGGRTTRPD